MSLFKEESVISAVTSSHTKRSVPFFTIFCLAGVLKFSSKWSGADYMDNLMKTVTGGVSSTAAMGKGVTEDQFKSKL